MGVSHETPEPPLPPPLALIPEAEQSYLVYIYSWIYHVNGAV